MATTTTKRTRKPSEAAPEKTNPTTAEEQKIPAAEKSTEKKTSAPKRKSLTAFDQNELIELKSCFYGKLIYRSHAGYALEWPEFGTVELIPFSELITMRNEQPAFFRNAWVVPVSDNANEVISALQLERYYTGLSMLENFDDIFAMDVDDMKALISGLSNQMKENVARRAYALYEDGTIDSVKVIEAVEESTGFELKE